MFSIPPLEPPAQAVWDGVIVHGQFVIPPGDPDYVVEADVTFAEDVQRLSPLPHSHLRGTRWDSRAVYPDGRGEQTDEEMMFTSFTYLVEGEAPADATEQDQ